MSSPEQPQSNPDIVAHDSVNDLLRFAHWDSSFTLTIGTDFIDYVSDVTSAVYPNVTDQPQEEKSQ